MIDPSRTVLVTDCDPLAWSVCDLLGEAPRVVVLPDEPLNEIPGARYFTFRAGTNPLEWDLGVDEIIRGLGLHTVAFHLTAPLPAGRTLLRLRRLGIRRVVLLGETRTRIGSPLRLTLGRLGSRAWRLVRDRFIRPQENIVKQYCAALSRGAGVGRPRLADAPLRIAHFVTALHTGAERQGSYAAIIQKRRGHDARIVSRLPLRGLEGHDRFLLDAERVPVRGLGEAVADGVRDAWGMRGLSDEQIRLLPPEMRTFVLNLVVELLGAPVDVLHCYVDDCNIVGAIAGILAGVQGIVLSFRNGNPSYFPRLYRPWMRPWYQALLNRPGVVFSSNSNAGARDYEHWLGLREGSVPVVRNAFIPQPALEPNAGNRWRAEHHIDPDAPVVAGVFALYPEKRPLQFLRCIERLRREVPKVRVFLAGSGSLEAEVRRHIRELGLNGVVELLGQRKDIPRILDGSDVLLLTSEREGTPNVVLEAQHFGCVPVVTDAGGTRETIVPGLTGELVGLEDINGIVNAVARLLKDRARRERMAEAGREYVATRYSPDALYAGNQELYRLALRDPIAGPELRMRMAG
ncbi:MAG TPA: glycosyltransferase [Gemmata sp.]|nr:glycosyltransferase [Gemmata sp.]